MQERARSGVEPLTLQREEPVGEPPPRRFGVILAGLVALFASAGLSWWIAKPSDESNVAAAPPPPAPPPAAAPSKPVTHVGYAPADPDAGQVRQSLADVQQAYADGGAEGLVQASAACARKLAADPSRLDYCLAFDVYAAQILPPDSGPAAVDWFHEAQDRDLALARAALPGSVDATNRLTQVAALTRAVVAPTAEDDNTPAQVAKAAPHKPPLAVKATQVAKPKPKAAKAKAVKSRRARPRSFDSSYDDWSPPGPTTLDEQYAREKAAEAELDRKVSQGLIDPPH